MFKALLILLPTVALARINIKIKAGLSEQDAKVDFSGSNVDIISDRERQTWQITDEKLKDAARDYSGGRPNDVYVRSPTPWNDLYKTYGWKEVQTTLYPSKATILGIRSEPVVITSQEYINNSSFKATFYKGISQRVEETVSSTWEKTGELTVEEEINYSIEVDVGEIGSASISYTSLWGEASNKSKSVVIASFSGVAVTLDPGESIVATLTATRNTVDVQVDYTASLDGFIACNYPERYKGHYFWGYDVNEVLSAANLPRNVSTTETIRIGFYSNAKVRISDKVTSKSDVEVKAVLL